jgi:hypothetical protein
MESGCDSGLSRLEEVSAAICVRSTAAEKGSKPKTDFFGAGVQTIVVPGQQTSVEGREQQEEGRR